jgi:hypothetical protein
MTLLLVLFVFLLGLLGCIVMGPLVGWVLMLLYYTRPLEKIRRQWTKEEAWIKQKIKRL